MKRIWTAVLLFLLLAGAPLFPQEKNGADKIRVIQVGEITKIDTRKQVITLKISSSSKRGRGGSRLPLGGLPRGFPGLRGGGNANPESRVSYSDDTPIVEATEPLSAGDLQVGDFVRVTGKPKNWDIDATEIERLPHTSKKP